jgi:hypothetical protein
MDGSGHEVLPDPAFASNQHRCIRIRDVFDDRPDGAHLRAAVRERGVLFRVGRLHRPHEHLLAQRLASRGPQ